MQIVSLSGTVSIKHRSPLANMHAALTHELGQSKGEHLVPDGTPLFASEVITEEFNDPLPCARWRARPARPFA